MKVGDYVRTKYGISKIISNPNENKFNIDIFKKDGITLHCIRQRDIIKLSPNIIDLIEVGDYVNGYLVTAVSKDVYGETIVFVGQKLIEEAGYYRSYYSKDIKTIVTKEQFSQMEYRIGE